jgi:hypothetical protein
MSNQSVIPNRITGLVDAPEPQKSNRKRAAKVPTSSVIQIPAMNLRVFKVVLEGTSSLICHSWDQKTKCGMLGKQAGEAQAAKAKKNPQECFEASLYTLGRAFRRSKSKVAIDDRKYFLPEKSMRFYFPAVAFKAAAVDACSHVEGITKVEARGAFHVLEEMVEIDGPCTPRVDMVRIGMGTADTRIRGQFQKWSVTLTVRHNANVLTCEQIVNLFDTGGFAVGVGEWRPEKNGSHGMFRVSRTLDM